MNNEINIVTHFFKVANDYPEKIAIIDKGVEISYANLLIMVKQKAHYFNAKGLGKNDRILVFIPMSIDLYVTVLALFYIGAVAVFIDEWVNRKRLALCCQIANCKAFIAPLYLRVLAYSMREIRKIPVWLKSSTVSNSLLNLNGEIDKNQTALITFTTGSTGMPKAANRTHSFLHAQFHALKSEIEPKTTDVDMPVLPIVLLMNLGIGCTSVISPFKATKPWKTDFKKIANLMVNKKINRLESSPDFVLRLAEYCYKNNTTLNDLKYVFTGGAPVFPQQAKLLTSAFPNTQINIVYGSTEAEPISMICAEELKNTSFSNTIGLSVGAICDEAEVYILTPKTGEYCIGSKEELINMQCKPFVIGEIIVAGNHVLRSYINNPIAIKENKIFIGEKCFHRTGDSGYLDEKGNLFLTGRVAMLIQTNNQIIAPFIYENAIMESGFSQSGTVLELNGLITVIIEGTKLDADKIRQYLKSKSLFFDTCIAVKKIPRDKRHHSKIEYNVLKKLLS